MTTIKCSSDCIHQKDGLCTLENAAANSTFSNSHCIYYENRSTATGRQAYNSTFADNHIQ